MEYNHTHSESDTGDKILTIDMIGQRSHEDNHNNNYNNIDHITTTT